MNRPYSPHIDLQAAARQAMLENGFQPDFPPEVQQQLAGLKSQPPPVAAGDGIRDLTALLWSSIDNDTSKDLDQIEYAERLANGDARVLVGVADVDVFVAQNTAIDQHASRETTTVYTGVRNFHMLPEELSTATSSLLEVDNKLCLVIEFTSGSDGCVKTCDIYRALVRNRAQLAYPSVGAWLEGRAPAPEKVAASTALQAQLKLQDEIAQSLKNARFQHGALNIENTETHPIMQKDEVVDIVRQEKNRATELIEDFMIAANESVARMLEKNNASSIRRVVKTPERWERIVALAAQMGEKLPAQADSKALNDFLTRRKAADPVHFPDVSLSVVKLMGPGEYVLQRPGDPEQGHFGLAVQNYTHSTAPNRRFADLLTQRLIKAVLTKQKPPYSDDQLAALARNCTLKEDAARKVERKVSKQIAALAVSGRTGEVFDAIVTGVTPKGTFVRVLKPHVEGILARGHEGMDVGDKIRAKLVSVDVQHGYIDFVKV
ncbi:MAG TPA: RNB domain-containing ribonuclease [Candidatus Saccharimonadales bacterium]|jgi:VacB/RNase II family 3'-5' exoribonuclease|nr:RNB domain-containing ribonuclease [Candidatus Saccharimonadales bacterium]